MRSNEILLAAVIVLSLVFFGIYTTYQFGRARKPSQLPPSRWHGLPDYNQDPDAGSRMVEQLCKKADGDISKLSADELKWLNAISAGNGEKMVMMTARRRAQELKQAQKRPASTP
jgi:hypothetical protein